LLAEFYNKNHSSHSKNRASLLINDQLISEDIDKANAFADRLEKIFSNENNERFDSHFFDATNDFVQSGGIDSMYGDQKKFKPEVSTHEVAKELKSLNNKTSLDGQGISSKY